MVGWEETSREFEIKVTDPTNFGAMGFISYKKFRRLVYEEDPSVWSGAGVLA